MSVTDDSFWSLVGDMYLLNSSYAQRWLTLMVAGHGNVPGVTIEDVRLLMLIEEHEYPQKSDLIKRVIYEPILELNAKTSFNMYFSYLFDRRKPIYGFNFTLTRKKTRRTFADDIGADLLVNIARIYTLPNELFLQASKYPLPVAALFRAHRDIENEVVKIDYSSHLYMVKVIEYSLVYINPLLDYIYNQKIH